MISWLKSNATLLCPTRDIALRATRHLNKIQRKSLFSNDLGTMKAAEGRWFEAIVYEMLLELSLSSDPIWGIAGKGADARNRGYRVSLGVNGLGYSRSGDIKIRGNGQDLAEVDLLFKNSKGSVAFGEIVTSQANIKEIEEEINYKKRLLGYLFNQDRVQFVLFSSTDLSKMTIVRRLLKDPDNTFVSTISCEEIRRFLKPHELRYWAHKPIHHPKLLKLESFTPTKEFNYKKMHDLKRKEFFQAILYGTHSKETLCKMSEWSLVKKIIIGGLYPNAVRALANQFEFSINGKNIAPTELFNSFTRVILAIDIPECKPIIYLKRKGRKEYLKMVMHRNGMFRCESRRTTKMLGFFLWLESTPPTIGTTITQKLINSSLFS